MICLDCGQDVRAVGKEQGGRVRLICGGYALVHVPLSAKALSRLAEDVLGD